MILFNISELINNPLEFLKELACVIPVMLLSLTFHEWGHAYAAHRCGDDNARNCGRMTMNPLRHIDPIGFVMILLVGFGWAKPVPVNSRNFRNYKKGEAIVSLAGVVMNLLLAILFAGLFVVVVRMYLKGTYSWLENGLALKVVMYGVALNLVLMLFNLLPVYPLDGYHIFELLFARRLPMKVFLFLRRYGQFILIAVLLMFRLFKISPITELTNLILNKLLQLALRIG